MTDDTLDGGQYIAFPLTLTPISPGTIRKAEIILEKCLQHESFFSDYEKGCDETCGDCTRCWRTKNYVAQAILDINSLSWEVWRHEKGKLLDFVGILRLSNVREGCSADVHYFFFDGKLSNKKQLLESWREWIFTDHGAWRGLHRLTAEIPRHAFALARHAYKMGFGGDVEVKHGKSTIHVEGIKREAVLWRGSWQDLFVMGYIKENT